MAEKIRCGVVGLKPEITLRCLIPWLGERVTFGA